MNFWIKQLLSSKPVQSLLYRLIRLYSWTFRFTIVNESEWIRHLKQGGRVLLCGWHQQFFSVIRHFNTYKPFSPSLMISQSRDGDLIAGVAQFTGWYPVRGSSSRGGKDALRVMISRLKENGLAGHIVDGPQGPAGIVKAGAIRLALSADAVIVPFYIDADRLWYFNSWDQFFIPKPFARVMLTFDAPIHLSQPEDESEFEMLRQKVERVMRRQIKVKQREGDDARSREKIKILKDNSRKVSKQNALD
ncbi:MAG: lysophospholipid acyltransferase family protein [Thermodesulfobacteriota bacterium]